MRKIFALVLISVFGVSVFAETGKLSRHHSSSGPRPVPLSRDSADDYIKLLARMGNFSLYCRAALPDSCRCRPSVEGDACREKQRTPECGNPLSEKYQAKHQAWRDVEARAERAYPGPRQFDSAETAAFNVSSLWFVNHHANGPVSAICNAVKTEFERVMELDSAELLTYLQNDFNENFEPTAAVTPRPPPPQDPNSSDAPAGDGPQNIPGEMMGPFGPE